MNRVCHLIFLFVKGNDSQPPVEAWMGALSELVHSLPLCKVLEVTEEDIMHTIFPHPTLSEMLLEASLASEGRAIHM